MDMIHTEVLNNDTACHFLLQLFHKCFEKHIVPSMWMKGIINPIPKDNTLEPRDLLSYRGITEELLWVVPCINYIVEF